MGFCRSSYTSLKWTDLLSSDVPPCITQRVREKAKISFCFLLKSKRKSESAIDGDEGLEIVMIG